MSPEEGDTRPRLLGAVLAGGRSRRYGSPKWRAPVGGVAMGRRAVTALEPHAAEVVALIDDPGAQEMLGVPCFPDLRPGSGPLGGLHTALSLARDRSLDGVALLGCDLPLVGEKAVGALVAHWTAEARAVVPRGPDGLQPVCALYAASALPVVERALDGGVRALHEVMEDLDPVRVPQERLATAEGRERVLLNVNTRDDRMRAEVLLHPGPPLVCVVGKKNSGKTGLAVGLAAELGHRGHRVMTVKHGHGFDLDTQGTDSWRHRHEGGAEKVLMVGPGELALVGGWGPEGEPPLRELVDRHLAGADIVVAEGWKAGPDPKVEVYRSAAHADPVYDPDAPVADTFLAMVTDDESFRPSRLSVFLLDAPDHVARLADRIEEALLGG